jgi:hypothetical protein
VSAFEAGTTCTFEDYDSIATQSGHKQKASAVSRGRAAPAAHRWRSLPRVRKRHQPKPAPVQTSRRASHRPRTGGKPEKAGQTNSDTVCGGLYAGLGHLRPMFSSGWKRWVPRMWTVAVAGCSHHQAAAGGPPPAHLAAVKRGFSSASHRQRRVRAVADM